MDITKDNYEKEVTNSDIPVIIDVFATWCGPCQMMTPIFEELTKEYQGKYKLVKVNVDEERDIAIQLGVTSVPTFIFIKDGKELTRTTGYISKDDFIAKIKSTLG